MSTSTGGSPVLPRRDPRVIPTIMQRLYCYVDETGQDTRGRFFLVAAVIVGGSVREELGRRLLLIGEESGKRRTKWQRANFERRLAYIDRVLRLESLQDSLFYAVYQGTRDYIPATTGTIAAAIKARAAGEYQATILVDGLNRKERDRVARGLRRSGIRYRSLRGIRDEADSLIRLADGLAGFLRDYEEGMPYAVDLYRRLPP